MFPQEEPRPLEEVPLPLPGGQYLSCRLGAPWALWPAGAGEGLAPVLSDQGTRLWERLSSSGPPYPSENSSGSLDADLGLQRECNREEVGMGWVVDSN